jgi:hypothetical protein
MSFREKSAWISLVVILVVFGIYFGDLARHLLSPVHAHRSYVVFFFLLVPLVVLLEVVLHILAAIRAPSDAKAPQDERDRFINLKATRIAFYVLVSGAFVSIGTVHVGAGPGLLANAVLCAIWLAELTRLGSQVYLYRRDS